MASIGNTLRRIRFHKRTTITCFFAVGALLLLFVSRTAVAIAKPDNLTTVKQQLVEKYGSDDYAHSLSSAVRKARDYLQFRVTQNARSHRQHKLAIVIDLDSAALPHYSNSGLGNVQAVAQDPITPYALSLFNYARAHHIAVFFITRRKKLHATATKVELKKAGYVGWNKIFFEPNDYHQQSAVPFKLESIKVIAVLGYDIVLNIGDRAIDLESSYSDMSFRLPSLRCQVA